MLVPRLEAFLPSKDTGNPEATASGFFVLHSQGSEDPMPVKPDALKVLEQAADDAGDSPRRPIWELLALALPTVSQMASYTVMQFIDTWILTRLGGVTAPTAAA